jgi:hypothetical protein
MKHEWDLLEDAATIIERKGHTKGVGRDRHGFCVVGAIHHAADAMLVFPSSRRRVLDRAMLAFARALSGADESDVSMVTIPIWNDKPDRTAAEVVARLRAVAAIEKARHAKGATVTKPEEMAECG